MALNLSFHPTALGDRLPKRSRAAIWVLERLEVNGDGNISGTGGVGVRKKQPRGTGGGTTDDSANLGL